MWGRDWVSGSRVGDGSRSWVRDGDGFCRIWSYGFSSTRVGTGDGAGSEGSELEIEAVAEVGRKENEGGVVTG
jgi:hypothetical protein